MDRRNLVRLQRKCRLALRIYMDVAEATCDALCECRTLPPSDEIQRKLDEKNREESQAQAMYIKARTDLLTGISRPNVNP